MLDELPDASGVWTRSPQLTAQPETLYALAATDNGRGSTIHVQP